MLSLLAIATLTQTVLRGCASAATSTIVPSAPSTSGEVHAIKVLREQLATAAGAQVDPDAPTAEALHGQVAAAMGQFARFSALLLEAFVPPAGADGGGEDLPRLEPLPALLPSGVLESSDALQLAKQWAAATARAAADPARLVARPAELPRLQLQYMPRDFATLTAQLHQRTCISCQHVPVEPALCLLCGALLCAGPHCRRERSAGEPIEGECTRHARQCGRGVGIFALVHQCVTLLVDETKSAYYASLYLDAQKLQYKPGIAPPPVALIHMIMLMAFIFTPIKASAGGCLST